MTREKQIAANRANAKKSTGPRTATGRSKSSRNALRHGLSAPRRLDPTTSVKAAAIARALVDDRASEEQLASAAEFAEAHLELLRIRALRRELAASIDLCPHRHCISWRPWTATSATPTPGGAGRRANFKDRDSRGSLNVFCQNEPNFRCQRGAAVEHIGRRPY